LNWIFSLTLPDGNTSPSEFPQGALMQNVTRSISLELSNPPFSPVRGRGAILATAMAVPEAAMDEDDGFVFGQNDVGANVANGRILDFRF
jgi:hypothetical protein